MSANDRDGFRQDYSCRERSAMLAVEGGEDRTYRGGFIVTPDGIVGLYDQTGKDYTAMDVVFDGRCYSISWPRKFTDRRLKTEARRFAATVAREAHADTGHRDRSSVLPWDAPLPLPTNKPEER